MISTAPASVGKPKWKACSTARIIRLSSISSAAGTIPAAMIPLTVSVAASTVVEDAQERPAGLGVAGQVDHRPSVTMPKVPSWPTTRPVRS